MLRIDTKTDGHVHTRYCGHARGEMEEYVQAALNIGLDRLIFLEHLECGISYFESTWLSPADFEEYWRTGLALKRKYQDRLDVGIGVEVGYNPEKRDEIQEFLKRYAWDRVGISYHFLAEEGRHINMLSRKKVNMDHFTTLGVDGVMERYFLGLLEAVQSLPGTVLCHLDAGLRHHPQVEMDERFRPMIDTILQEAAQRQMALEINTSGFAIRGLPFPDLAIISRARELGMTLAAGSDAHRPEDVGRYFERLPELL